MTGHVGDTITRLRGSDAAMREGAAPARERRKQSGPSAAANGNAKCDSPRPVAAPSSDMVPQFERSSLVLWKRPLTTLYYFVRETLELIRQYSIKLWHNKVMVIFLLLTFLILLAVYHIPGPHQQYVTVLRKEFLWCIYWVGLGILSSVGLGTGLHTFLLYLGPHIAAVTLAAYECMSTDFPAPPYPDDIVCPDTEMGAMSMWTIMSKLRLEAFMWGAGTAIGELPPYFMARAARLSGQMDEEEQEIEDLITEHHKHPSEKLAVQQEGSHAPDWKSGFKNFLDRGKIAVHDLVQRVGFMGILLCASIPNPLFDLAGITCGHFLVPFWTFFGATLIGKAVIKMHIQKLFVIFIFSEHHVENVINSVKFLPYGASLQVPFKEYLQKQKAKLHHKPGVEVAQSASWLSWVFEKLVLVMVVYFVVSIINSMAQSFHKRLARAHKKNLE